jgi:integrase
MLFSTATQNFINDLGLPRRRKVLAQNTQRLYAIYSRRAAESLGPLSLSDITNATIRDFVSELRKEGLAPSTIQGHLATLKLVIDSVRNEDGDSIYSKKWNLDFIAAPVVKQAEQNAPVATPQDVEKAITRDDVLVPFLAASGLRISEALALQIGTKDDCYDPPTGVIHIRKTLRTFAARRDVYLPQSFRAWLNSRISGEKMFDISYDRLKYELKEMGLPMPHSYRRLYALHCRKNHMVESVLKYLLGSKGTDIPRYDHSGDVEFIRAEVERVGLPFALS